MEKRNETQSVFATLSALNVNEHVEQKEGLTYLSWSWAWHAIKSKYDDVEYDIRHWDGKPYLYDESLGYMVETSVTIQGEKKTMWLPIMDAKNKAMKSFDYTYQVWDKYKKQYVDKVVKAATMFDINTAIMRCLVKNLAMFGLGLYIYAGEDIPQAEAEENRNNLEQEAISALLDCTTKDEMVATWNKYKTIVRSDKNSDFYKAAQQISAQLNGTH